MARKSINEYSQALVVALPSSNWNSCLLMLMLLMMLVVVVVATLTVVVNVAVVAVDLASNSSTARHSVPKQCSLGEQAVLSAKFQF